MSTEEGSGDPGISRGDDDPEQLDHEQPDDAAGGWGDDAPEAFERQQGEAADSWGDSDPIRPPREALSEAVDAPAPTVQPLPDISWGDDAP